MLTVVVLHGILAGVLGIFWALAGAGIYGSPLALDGPIVIVIVVFLLVGPFAAFISGIMIFESPRLASFCLILCGSLSGFISLGVAFVAGNIIPLLLVSIPMLLLGFLLKAALHQQGVRQFNQFWTSATQSLSVDQQSLTTDTLTVTQPPPHSSTVLPPLHQVEQVPTESTLTTTIATNPAIVEIVPPISPSTPLKSQSESLIYRDNLNIALGACIFFIAMIVTWFLDNLVVFANPFGFEKPPQVIGVHFIRKSDIYTILLISQPTLFLPFLRRWLTIRWELIIGIWIAQIIIILLWLIP